MLCSKDSTTRHCRKGDPQVAFQHRGLCEQMSLVMLKADCGPQQWGSPGMGEANVCFCLLLFLEVNSREVAHLY